MKKELDDLLCTRYPLIFANRNRPKTESCMGFGFTCGDGWFTLIDTLCERLQFHTDRNGAPQIIAMQVKEKWGALAFYVASATDEQFGMIDMAEALSTHICEVCGHPGRVLVHGAVMTRCPDHAPAGSVTHEDFVAQGNVPGIAP